MNRFAILDRRGATIWFASALFLLGPASAPASAQSTGTVTGKVSNAATSVFLEAAVVEAVGTGRSVLTDREGGYELTLPAGTATLAITYTGLERQTVTVTVPAGSRVVRNVELSSGVYKMDPFTVSGSREGSAAAITRQREAPNVKNIVDMRGWKRWTFPFIVAGANSIALYLMSQLLKPWVAGIWQRYLGKDIFLIAGPECESVLRYPAIGLTFWLVVWWMYRNKFFVRI